MGKLQVLAGMDPFSQLVYLKIGPGCIIAALSQTTFWNAFYWIKMYEFRLKFYWRLLLRVQLTISQHWSRHWLGAGQATSHCKTQWWLVYWRIYASLGLIGLIWLLWDVSSSLCCNRGGALYKASLMFGHSVVSLGVTIYPLISVAHRLWSFGLPCWPDHQYGSG